MNLCIADAAPQRPYSSPPYRTWLAASGIAAAEFYRLDDRYVIRFPDIADFEIASDVQNILCRPSGDCAEATLRNLFLDQVVPLVLSHQGKLVLHASAVEMPSGAIAFAGISGRGKSTLAASFATTGAAFLSDDALILERCGTDTVYRVSPGHPSIRLWEDSRSALIPRDAMKAPPDGSSAKSRLVVGAGVKFCEQSRELRKVYFLGDGSARTISISRASHSEALLQWIRNVFLLDTGEAEALARNFDRLWHLARDVEAYHLDFPRDFDMAGTVREAIAKHAMEK
jgi:hypothetical protein